MAEFIPVNPFDIAIFGATGDLSRRKLLPALYHRFLDGQIDASCCILGVARSKLTREGFITMAKEACQTYTGEWQATKWQAFAKQLDYITMDATKPDTDWQSFSSSLNTDGRTRIFYLATTPLIYVDTCQALAKAGLNTTRNQARFGKTDR